MKSSVHSLSCDDKLNHLYVSGNTESLDTLLRIRLGLETYRLYFIRVFLFIPIILQGTLLLCIMLACGVQ